jgi:hypothetical protein
MDPKAAGEHLAAYFNQLSPQEAQQALSAFLGQPVPLDMIGQLQGKSTDGEDPSTSGDAPSATLSPV